MAVLNLEYYNNTDKYSDGDIEEEILSYVKGEISWEQLKAGGRLYPVLYHLSPLRENILNWYPFSKGCRVLEIGSGCGALTGLLCRKAGYVVSAELSRRRATINYERHKEYENLEILVGNLNEMTFPEPFDYVILNGVLEYAMSFTGGDRPYEQFLERIRPLLKEDGHLLIAIENRLGLKYFNGAPEDHTGHYYEGIDQYPDNHTVRTFSKEELNSLIQSCGLSVKRWYYPYPDYKFPTEIFTDETVCTFGYGKPFVNLDEKRYRIFEEQGLWQTLSREKVTASFANSFLVDISDASPEEKPLYVKLNNDRADRFRIATSIVQNKEGIRVCKAPLTKEAEGHIRRLAKGSKMTPAPAFVNLQGTLKDGRIYYPFLESETLDSQIKNMIRQGETDRLVKTLHKVFDQYGKGARLSDAYETDAFVEMFGPAKLSRALACVQPANIDLICDNIFTAADGYRIIDCEWVFDMPIPMAFIIWRSVNELYTKHQKLHDLIDRERLMLEFDIDDKMSRVFWQWATYFAKEYVGSSSLEQYTKVMKQLSIDWLVQEKLREDILCSSLYYDLGEGFSEENKLYSETVLTEGRFTVTYHLNGLGQVKRLRWDPLEGVCCICRIEKVSGAEAVPANASGEEEEGQLFLTPDPIYMLEAEAFPEQITVEGKIRRFDGKQLAAYIQEHLPALQWGGVRLQETMKKQQDKLDELERELSRSQAACDQITAEKNRLDQMNTMLTQEFTDLQEEYRRAVKELEEIHASRSWRLLNKLKGN